MSLSTKCWSILVLVLVKHVKANLRDHLQLQGWIHEAAGHAERVNVGQGVPSALYLLPTFPAP